jgi:hypothetical protein
LLTTSSVKEFEKRKFLESPPQLILVIVGGTKINSNLLVI